MKPYPIDKHGVLVQAGMAVGKSKEEAKHIKRLVEQRGIDGIAVLKISFRKTFTAQVLA
jgi:benzoyl-CoA reductase/2-hydroxyglutaryl-CoA dehydratase subunit BcrC/BadD/HgdB